MGTKMVKYSAIKVSSGAKGRIGFEGSANAYATVNGKTGKGLSSPIRWMDKTYSSEEAAMKALVRLSGDCLNQLAVKYYKETTKGTEVYWLVRTEFLA